MLGDVQGVLSQQHVWGSDLPILLWKFRVFAASNIQAATKE